MISQATSGYVMFGQVLSVYIRIFQVNSGHSG